jgi:hypothetical protein
MRKYTLIVFHIGREEKIADIMKPAWLYRKGETAITTMQVEQEAVCCVAGHTMQVKVYLPESQG